MTRSFRFGKVWILLQGSGAIEGEGHTKMNQLLQLSSPLIVPTGKTPMRFPQV